VDATYVNDLGSLKNFQEDKRLYGKHNNSAIFFLLFILFPLEHINSQHPEHIEDSLIMKEELNPLPEKRKRIFYNA
jgi:hypothetical protein